jgi:hypothetical protein
VSTASGSGGATAGGGDTGSGGSTGTGGGATGGAAGSGSTGSGGAVSSGGTTGSGGAAGNGATGSGGSATGGATGSGGSGSGTNLVTNGDFSQGMTGWNVSENTPMSMGVNNGQFCISLNSGTNEVIVGWGDGTAAANISASSTYTLSYQASASAGLSEFDAHVGQAVSPYTLDKDVGNETLTSSMQTFTHMFMPAQNDSQAGVAFLIKASGGTSMVCIDNVSLTQN